MFVIANFTLKKGSLVKDKNIQTYSIAVGIVFYAAIYMYLLFSKSEFLAVFNRFVVYIIGVDLLLSALFFSNKTTKASVMVHSLEELCDKNGHKKNDYNNLDDSTSIETSPNDNDEAQLSSSGDSDEEDEDNDEDCESDSTSNEQDLDTESNSHKNELQHDTDDKLHKQTLSKDADDLETLVLNNDIVDQLEQISSTVQTGPKKRGRKPKSALSQS